MTDAPLPPATPGGLNQAPPTGGSAQAAPATDGGCLVLIGITMFAVTWLLPFAILFWFGLVTLAARISGRVLTQAQAFSHVSFDAGFWAGLVTAAACLLIVLWVWLDSKGQQILGFLTWGLAVLPLGLATLVGGGTWVWQTFLDKPEHDGGFATAATLLLSAGLLGPLPIAGQIGTDTIGWLWRVSQRTSMVAGFVAGGTIVASLAMGIVDWVVAPTVLPEIESVLQLLPSDPVGQRDALPKFALNFAGAFMRPRRIVGAAAEVTPSDVPPPLVAPERKATLPRWVLPAVARGIAATAPLLAQPTAQDETGACFEALGSDCGDKPCPVDQVKALLMMRRFQEADAADIAHATMLEVCGGAKPADRNWQAAYYKRAHWRRIDEYRRVSKLCTFDERAEDARVTFPVPAYSDIDDRTLHAAMCRLREVDQCVLRAKYFDDMPDALIMGRCGLPSLAMLRKQLERARKELKKVLTH